MKPYIFTCLLFFTANCLIAQSSGNVDLGSEISNGVMTDGCLASCSPTYCTQTGDNAGNHPVETITLIISGIPATNSVEIVFTSVLCGTFSGLDGGDDIFVDGTQIVDGSGNATIDATVCVEGGADITIEFTVNRRDEIINVSWDSGATDPGAPCFMMTAPVELTKFEAVKQNRSVDLFWTTVSEINNDKFVVQHSTNGTDFRTIGTELGFGTTYDERDYQFSHDTPAEGLNYYRLKQVDFDGSTSVSEIVAVEYNTTSRLNVYPTYATDYLNIEGAQSESGSIFNISGQIIETINLEEYTRVSLVNYQSGIYFLQIDNETIRFVVE